VTEESRPRSGDSVRRGPVLNREVDRTLRAVLIGILREGQRDLGRGRDLDA
jgi:hypothetical protein